MTSASPSWKEATDTTSGDATKYGVPDGLKKNNQLFNGDLDVDNVDVNSPWFFRDNKCQIQNPANTFGYKLRTSALAADRDVTLPLLTGADSFVFEDHTQDLQNKKIANYLDFDEIAAPASPATDDYRVYVDSTANSLSMKDSAGTVVVYVTTTGTQTLTNKTLTTPTITVLDNAFTVQDNGDNTKQFNVDLANLTTSTTRTLTMADRNVDLAKVGKTVIAIAASDETTALTTGTAKATFRMPFAMTLTDIRASVTTAPTTSGTLTVDVNEGGTTLMTTNKLTIDVTEFSTETAATAPALTDTSLANDAEITVDIDAISGGATETGLKVYLIGYET